MHERFQILLLSLFKKSSVLSIIFLILLFSNSIFLLILNMLSLVLLYLFQCFNKQSKMTILLLLILNVLFIYPNLKDTTTIEVESSTNGITIHFISTGNSDSILIKSQGQYTLIDTGDWNDHLTLYNYLKNEGVNQLDNLILTHYHADHLGTAETIIKAFNPKTTFVPNGSANTLAYNRFIKSVKHATVPLQEIPIPFGDATITFYNTTGDLENENNNSLVTLLQYGNDRLLFMADAEKEVEAQLLISDIDLIKIGHHGSYTSSTTKFLKQTSPNHAVITVGKNNPYAHPHPSTMTKLETLKIPVYRTDEQGTLKFISTGDGVISLQEAGSYTPGLK